jgi:L-alanine-DL-glutamate epimerase-like enolase superfamily enzyme
MKIKSVEAYWVHIPIASGESEFTRHDFRNLARQRSPAGFIVEYSLGANPLLHDLVEESFPVAAGMIEVPDRPGLGITVREDFLAKHTVKS